MYWLFMRFKILPGTYYRLPEGEKTVIRAFADYYVEHAKEG